MVVLSVRLHGAGDMDRKEFGRTPDGDSYHKEDVARGAGG